MAKLNNTKIQLSEYARQNWRVNLPAEVDYREVFVPSFWANSAARFVRGDIIEVFAEDGTLYAQLIVRAATKVSAVVGELLLKDFRLPTPVAAPSEAAAPAAAGTTPATTPAAPSEAAAPAAAGTTPATTPAATPAAPTPAPATAVWKGPQLKWVVLRHDGEYMHKGIESKEEAQKLIDDNVEALA